MLKPLFDRVLVKADPDEITTKAGLIVPHTAARDGTHSGIVLSVGFRYGENSIKIPLSVKEGDKIIYGRNFSGYEYTENGEKFIIMREIDVIGIKND